MCFLFGFFWISLFNVYEVKTDYVNVSAIALRDGVCVSEKEYYPVKSEEGIFYIYSSCENNISKGDVVFVSGKVEKNEYFNYDLFLSGKVKGVVYEEVEILEKQEKNSISKLKEKIKNNLRQILSPYNSDLGGMILFGKSFSANLLVKNVFQKIGLSHVVVTSGQHLSIFVDVFNFVLQSASFLFLTGFNFLFVVLFLIFIGFTVSLFRASIMFVYNVLARCLGRLPDKINNLLVCLVLIVLINPFVLFYDVGFKLSFLSVFGIMFIFPLIKEKVRRYEVGGLKTYFVDLILIAFSILFSTYPFIAYTFAEVSLVSPLANFILVPFILPIIFGVMFVILLSFVWMGLAKLVGIVVDFFMNIFLQIAILLSNIRLSVLVVSQISFGLIMVYYICLVTVVMYLYMRNKKIKLIGCLI